MTPARSPAAEAGFTIIEVLVAATLLLVGMLGVVTMVNGANRAVTDAREREAATNLAREIAEQTRSIPFAQVDAATLPGRLQAMPGLADTGAAPGWEISRRNIDFTVQASVCSVDDTRDGLGDHSEGGFCEPSSAADDATPRDLKRIGIDVTWSSLGRSRTVTQTAVVSPGNGRDAPVIKSLVASSPTVPEPTHPVISSDATTQVTFTVEGSATAEQIIWSVDGVDQTPAAVPAAAPKTWTFVLPITALTDGTYSVGARAVDADGIEGPPHEIPLELNRRLPRAPTITGAGHNTVRDGGTNVEAVEVEWLANPERNVEGYRVFRSDGSLACPGSPTATDESLACVDLTPVAGPYEVAAIFRALDGSLSNGVRATVVPAAGTSTTTVPPSLKRLYFTPGLASTTGCPATADATAGSTMLDPYTFPATETSYAATAARRFCGPPAPSTITLPASSSTSPTTRVSVWARNTSGGASQDCTISASAGLAGYGMAQASQTHVIENRTHTAVNRVFTVTHDAVQMSAGARLMVDLDGSGSCTNAWFDFAAADVPAFAEYMQPGSTTTTTAPAPATPTGLTITATTGGPRLTWTQPTTGAAAESFRIYRGGTDWTDRYDRTGDAVPEYTDPAPEAGRQYWVTAVGPNLVESAPVGPVTTP